MGSSPWEEARFGQTRVWWRSEGGVAETVIVGNMVRAAAEYLSGKFDRLMAEQGYAIGFHDWMDAPTYESASRALWQKWLASKQNIRSVSILTTSRIMRMGIAVANLAYPTVKFKVYSDRQEYERARAKLMRSVPRPV
jgi:hypothetical protein